jgi:hypothetical protein
MNESPKTERTKNPVLSPQFGQGRKNRESISNTASDSNDESDNKDSSEVSDDKKMYDDVYCAACGHEVYCPCGCELSCDNCLYGHPLSGEEIIILIETIDALNEETDDDFQQDQR